MTMIIAKKILWLNSLTDDTHWPSFDFPFVFTESDIELESCMRVLQSKIAGS